jgi:hypothetical protein
MSDQKVQENRVRRAAERQGLALRKSRRRDPRALDYGEYWLMSLLAGVPERSHDAWTGPFRSLADVEMYLGADDHERAEIEAELDA